MIANLLIGGNELEVKADGTPSQKSQVLGFYNRGFGSGETNIVDIYQ